MCDRMQDYKLTLNKTEPEEGEKLIYLASGNIRCNKEQMGQMVAPVNLPSVTCCQTVENNYEVKQTEDIKRLDLLHGWGKSVSFITNTSNKLHLSSALHSLAQTPVVAKSGKVRESGSIEQNNHDNKIIFQNLHQTLPSSFECKREQRFNKRVSKQAGGIEFSHHETF